MIVYVEQTVVTTLDLDPADYDLDETATQAQLAEKAKADSSLYEVLESPYTIVAADFDVITDIDEIEQLNAETMTWEMNVKFAGRRDPVQ
jgi:hypothetical protein